ncbi:MAG: phosphate acyltransferase, partial [Azospira sp.]|nr:phosphate acyltransferase [Azospira sp.]
EFIYRTGVGMRAIFSAARQGEPARLIYTDGEDEKVLHAVQIIIEERLARPILIGRPEVIGMRLEKLGSRLVAGKHFEIVNPNQDERYKECWTAYHQLMKRHGVTVDVAKARLRQDTTIIGAMLLHLGYAEGMICGMSGRFAHHLRQVEEIIGKAPGVKTMAAMNHLLLPGRALFICDTHVNENPSAGELAEIALLAAAEVHRFGIQPKVAMLSHSNFGSSASASAKKMAEATRLLRELAPELEADGEMHGDTALSQDIRDCCDPDSPLKGEANLLVMPNLDSANISYNLLKMTGGEGVTIGPILLGAARPVHVLTATATVRRLVNMTALTVIEARQQKQEAAAR